MIVSGVKIYILHKISLTTACAMKLGEKSIENKTSSPLIVGHAVSNVCICFNGEENALYVYKRGEKG